ncbi:DegT/DnrJ/EryC1/StrS family aminotransferase [Candidatus Avelusimicrobium caledoniensis]|uniref:DegT/DnrJ/EryC1/StrS family aminotransferase n=1 Tax=Candidatus Avelusimicrobium caledoniensis TaxID=3416220 RepID=UPI003D09B185
MEKIFVTKPFLPPQAEYTKWLTQIYHNEQLTNQGPLVCELEKQLQELLDVARLQYVTNGTIALQLALEALDIRDGEIITTPFSYVATTSSILWQRCKPVFVDIEPDNFTIDPAKIEVAITPKTRAIMPVHVFGYACDVEKIEQIAQKHGLKVIYDAAHAFGSVYKNKALVSYGDVSTLSFHATKLFHTVEGGACIVHDEKTNHKLDLAKRFGHLGDTHYQLGINGKQSEFHAAMGLAILPHLAEIISKRKAICEMYDKELSGYVSRPKPQPDLQYNYAYYPVLFKDEQTLLRVFQALNKEQIYPRRYFYPSLNTLPYLEDKQACPVSEDICSRIACLPLYPKLPLEQVERICSIVRENI